MALFMPADILLPRTDLTKWSVIACDQYTQEGEYWEKVKNFVGEAYSSLNLIVPEANIRGDVKALTVSANQNMEKYLKADIFEHHKNAMIYIERTLKDGSVRKGLVGAIDLEGYNLNLGALSPICATEKTVKERLPIRIEVRRTAQLEIPHSMMLINDIEKTVIEPLCTKVKERAPLYDFTLMEEAGKIKGWLLLESEKEKVDKALSKLFEKMKEAGLPLIAVGDGNHSVAAARVLWEEIRENLTKQERENHPARFLLTELVNLYDEGLKFYPIHRVVFDVDKAKLIKEIAEKKIDATDVTALQSFLDEYIEKNGGAVDYIHGEDALNELCERKNAIGFILPAYDKTKLFSTVVKEGVLPRKAFSMGKAEDKRFYLEARLIK